MSNEQNNVIYMKNDNRFSGFRFNKDTDYAYNEYSDKEGDIEMSEKHSMDTLFNELKADMREREERSRKEITERESRFEKQMERHVSESTIREERYREDSKDREERIFVALDKLETKMDSHAKHTETMKTQNFWGNVALFVGMLAIVITLIIKVG